MRDSMVFYRSFWEAATDLSEEDQLKVFRAIIGYALDGIEPEGKGIASAIFKMAKPQIDANGQRYKNGMKGGRPKTEAEPDDNQAVTEQKPKDNQTITKEEPNKNQSITKAEPNVNVNVNVNDNENVNVNNKTRARAQTFTPPSLEEVKAYCKERSSKVDPERWYDFYASKGWMIGKNRMKDWKAAVRTWEHDTGRSPPDDVKRFGFTQRQYDDDFYDSLVKGFD